MSQDWYSRTRGLVSDRYGLTVLRGTVRVVRRFAEEAPLSALQPIQKPPTRTRASPSPPDIEKPGGRKKAVAGVEIGMMPEGQGSTFEPEEDWEPQG